MIKYECVDYIVIIHYSEGSYMDSQYSELSWVQLVSPLHPIEVYGSTSWSLASVDSLSPDTQHFIGTDLN